jgi:hypothetical protein
MKKIWRGKNTHRPRTNRLSNTQQPKHTHTQPTKPKINNIQHCRHSPPKPPAPNGSNFTGECNRHTLRDRSRSLQHSNELLIDDTNFFFIYLTIIFGAAAQRAH